MNNFQKLGEGLPVLQLMFAIQQHQKSASIWKDDTYLRDYPQGPFGDCESIILRFSHLSGLEGEKALAEDPQTFDQHECIDQPVFKLLPEARGLIFNLMSFVQGERLGRVIINKINPGGVIYPHADSEAHAGYYDRFHIVLNSSPGVDFRCGDERVYMETGSCWWFNNKIEHEVINNSATERVHMVIDIRTSK